MTKKYVTMNEVCPVTIGEMYDFIEAVSFESDTEITEEEITIEKKENNEGFNDLEDILSLMFDNFVEVISSKYNFNNEKLVVSIKDEFDNGNHVMVISGIDKYNEPLTLEVTL